MYKHKLFFPLFFIFVLIGAVRFTPWDRVNWGKFEVLPGSSLTVTGEAKQELTSQIARFSASVVVSNDDKQTAVDEVNQKMAAVIQAVKDFGIDQKDIQTQSVSVNEAVEPNQPEIFRMPSVARWRAQNSISIVLRQVDQASALTDLLTSLEATDVYGPQFGLDDTLEAETALLGQAIDNARQKADAIAKASDRKLGKVLTVEEAGSRSQITPFLAAEKADMGLSAPIEPGTETVYKTVTVTFELN